MSRELCRYYCVGKKCYRNSSCRYVHDDRERERYINAVEQERVRTFRQLQEAMGEENPDDNEGEYEQDLNS